MDLAFSRLLLDTHTIDRAVADSDFRRRLTEAATNGILHLLITHVQIDEIVDTPESKDKRPALLEVLASLPAERIPTYGFILNLSRLDNARLTDDEGAALIEALRGENLKHTEDSVLIATAGYEDAAFVSSDTRALAAARRHGIAALSLDELDAMLR